MSQKLTMKQPLKVLRAIRQTEYGQRQMSYTSGVIEITLHMPDGRTIGKCNFSSVTSLGFFLQDGKSMLVDVCELADEGAKL